MKNFGTSLMKLSGLADPLSLIPDQSNSLPWPFLIASSLNKHGKIKFKLVSLLNCEIGLEFTFSSKGSCR